MDETVVRKFVLQNAVFYNGKPNSGAVVGKILATHPELKSDVPKLMKEIGTVVKQVSKLSLDKQKEELAKLDSSMLEKQVRVESDELPPLENAQRGRVVMRMAPFPSGPLHIGNARMAILNDEYCNKYDGKLILFFDDTAGTTVGEITTRDGTKKLSMKEIVPDAYKLIPEGIKWLGIDWDEEMFKSDRIEIFYDYCKKLIDMERAYVCTCPADEFRSKYKSTGVNCPCRARSAKENLALWNKMLDGGFAPGEAAVRLSSGMDYKDPALRDPTIMRIADKPHPRVGTKYKVWPLLEFSWAIDDHLIGATHILRGKDLVKEDVIETWVWGYFNWPKAEFLHYGKFIIDKEYGVISKTKTRELVESGHFSGWDDPRTWSLQSLKRRGIRPEAVRKFILSFGMSLTDVNCSPEKLYSMNRQIIDADAKRFFFIAAPVKFKLDGAPAKVAKVPVHPEYPDKGSRDFKMGKSPEIIIDELDMDLFKENKFVRLKDYCNVSLLKGELVYAKDQDEVYKIPKVHWLPAEGNIPVTIVTLDGKILKGVGEPSLAKAKVDDIIQLERFGFCRVDGRDGDAVRLWFSHK